MPTPRRSRKPARPAKAARKAAKAAKKPLYLDLEMVWEATLDGEFRCEVRRLKSGPGALILTRAGHVLKSWLVPLSYGAAFGPDAADVMYWQDLCADYVDALSRRTP